MEEMWKQIPEYPLYEISNFGNVRSWNGLGKRYGVKQNNPRYLKRNIGTTGYYRITLCNNTGQKQFKVHQLVLNAFNKTCPDGYITRHLDGNKLNNKIDNLVWGNYIENEHDKLNHNRSNRGERNGMSKLTIDEVKKIRQLYSTNQYSQYKLGKMFSVTRSAIMVIVTNRTWKHI